MSYKDPVEQRAYQRQWRAARRALYTDGVVCEKCAGTPIDWHHRDPNTKLEHKIWTWAIPRLEAELEKCIPLCRRCHNEVHHPTRPVPHGTHSGYSYHGCRCSECKAGHARYQRDYVARSA
jgi:hypothetical protein